jgi:small subunit ribosomal protein S17
MSDRGVKKRLTGLVIGHKLSKTAVVSVSRLKRHKSYKKYLTVQKKYMVHDPSNQCQVGDKVRIIESRPISKTKKWMLFDVVERAAEIGEEIGGGETVGA